MANGEIRNGNQLGSMHICVQNYMLLLLVELTGAYLSWIRVSPVHHVLRHGVRREQQHHLQQHNIGNASLYITSCQYCGSVNFFYKSGSNTGFKKIRIQIHYTTKLSFLLIFL